MNDEASNNELTLERAIRAKKLAAKIVTIHGEAYLPYFIRMEREVERLSKEREAFGRAVEIAR